MSFDQARTNNAMTHVLVLSAKMSNERLWKTININNKFRPTFGLKNTR